MSNIKKLIEKFSSNFDFNKLVNIVDYIQPTKYIVSSQNYDNSYSTPVLTPGKSFILGYTNEKEGIYEANQNNPIILFDDFTCSFHWVDFPFKIKSSASKIIIPINKNKINFRYVYFAMKEIKINISEHKRQWIQNFSNISIPIPPLEIQNEIVRILDKYTELEKELEKELELRTRQYDYYRNKLFVDFVNFEYNPLWKVTNWNKKFNNVEKNKQQKITKFLSVSAKKLKELLVEEGNIKLLSTGIFDGYTNELLANNFICEGEVITLPEGGNANIKYWNGKFVNSLNLIATSSNDNLYSLKFIYYFLIFKNKWIENQYRGSNVKHPNMAEILELKIPIPSFKKQQKIVEILDKFSNIINNLENGIPKEIELRKKQYLYWRNKLLSF